MKEQTKEPITNTGALIAKRISIAIPVWTRVVSLVIKLIRLPRPKLSISFKLKELTFKKIRFLKSVPKPWEATLAKYWHTKVDKKPNIQKAIIIKPGYNIFPTP